MRFATSDRTTITILEVGFTSSVPPMEVESLPIPDDFDFGERVAIKLLPNPCRLALAFRDKVLIWDAPKSEYLLDYTDTELIPKISFSPDGRFFACRTTGSEIYLWRETPAGYILHRTIPCGPASSHPLISRNGESIVTFGGRTIRLWRTKGPIAPLPPSVFTRTPQHTENFILDFSCDGRSAAVAVQKGFVITVLDLESGAPQLTINASMEVFGLRMIRNSAIAIGRWKAVTWNIPLPVHVSDLRVGLEGSSRIIRFRGLWHNDSLTHATIDSRYIAFIAGPGATCLYIHDAYTGQYIAQGCTRRRVIPWLAPRGSDIWCADVWCVDDQGEADVWKARWQGGGLEPLRNDLHVNRAGLFLDRPEAGYPWGSSHGYFVTKDWWILGPDGERLLVLPSLWRSDAVRRMWKEKFLALLHSDLSEPVILELLYICDHSGSYQTSQSLQPLAPDLAVGHPGCRYPKRQVVGHRNVSM